MIRIDRFTKGAQESAERAAAIMQRYGHHQIDTEHMLLALIEQPRGGISPILAFLNVDANTLAAGLDGILRAMPKGDFVTAGAGQVPITPGVVQVIALANEEANRREELISTGHLLLAIFNAPDTALAHLLDDSGLTRDRVYDAIQQMRG